VKPRSRAPTRSALDAAFTALADPARRDMIRLLALKPLRAGELAERVRMSPQALSRHLRVLRKAGLVAEAGIESDARVRVYRVPEHAFESLQRWLAEAESLWRRQLQAFKAYSEATHARGTKT
jgi:DNA-binding transcriptional ArsR family regulator